MVAALILPLGPAIGTRGQNERVPKDEAENVETIFSADHFHRRRIEKKTRKYANVATCTCSVCARIRKDVTCGPRARVRGLQSATKPECDTPVACPGTPKTHERLEAHGWEVFLPSNGRAISRDGYEFSTKTFECLSYYTLSAVRSTNVRVYRREIMP
jgi:hypothetical protein